jgi:hypothetical protein
MIRDEPPLAERGTWDLGKGLTGDAIDIAIELMHVVLRTATGFKSCLSLSMG